MSSSEPRDQLAAIIAAAMSSSPNEGWLVLPGPVSLIPGFAREITDVVLRNGWCPPPRVIENVDDLDEMPSDSAVRDSRGRIWFRGSEGCKWVSGYVQRDSEWFAGDRLTVLWEPEEAAL